MLEVIATERLKSRSSSGAVTDWIDSELVRTRSPSLSEMRGRAPLWRQLASRLLVPRAPAATITPRAVCVRPLLAQPGAGALAGDRVAVGAVGGAERADLGHLALGLDLDPELLGEPEVVLHQRVLGPVAAADHAAAAAHAAGAVRALAAEEGVLDLDAGLVEEDADPGVGEGLADADLLAVFLQQLVGRPDAFVLDHAEHPLGGVVVRRQLAAPSCPARSTAGR